MKDAVTGRVDAYALDQDLGAWDQKAGGYEEGGGGDVAWDHDLLAV